MLISYLHLFLQTSNISLPLSHSQLIHLLLFSQWTRKQRGREPPKPFTATPAQLCVQISSLPIVPGTHHTFSGFKTSAFALASAWNALFPHAHFYFFQVAYVIYHDHSYKTAISLFISFIKLLFHSLIKIWYPISLFV